MSEVGNYKVIVGVLAVLLIAILVYLAKPAMFIPLDKPPAPTPAAAPAPAAQPPAPPVVVQSAPVQSPPLVIQPSPVVSVPGVQSVPQPVPGVQSVPIVIQPASQPDVPAVLVVPTQSNIQKIVIYKDFANLNIPTSDKVLHLAELEIYDKNNRKLAFNEVDIKYDSRSLIDYPANLLMDNNLDNFIHTLDGLPKPTITVTLKVPQPLKSVVVYNRKNCCQNRLSNAILELYDTNNKIYKATTLNADLRQELLL